MKMTYNNTNIRDFVRAVEAAHFRTSSDTGANDCALLIWNRVREFAGFEPLNKQDLPAYCYTHKKYHIIQNDYGCARTLREITE